MQSFGNWIRIIVPLGIYQSVLISFWVTSQRLDFFSSLNCQIILLQYRINSCKGFLFTFSSGSNKYVQLCRLMTTSSKADTIHQPSLNYASATATNTRLTFHHELQTNAEQRGTVNEINVKMSSSNFIAHLISHLVNRIFSVTRPRLPATWKANYHSANRGTMVSNHRKAGSNKENHIY